jgi:serine protease Do
MSHVRPHHLLAGALLLGAGLACQRAPAPSAALAAPPPIEPRPSELRTLAVPTPPVPVEVPSLAPLVERVLPTVVSIEVDRAPAAGEGDDAEDDDSQAPLPEGHPPVPGTQRGAERAGAGVLIGGRGLVLTSFHFVRDAAGLAVHLADGSTHEADLVGRDGPTDLALLRLRHPPRNLQVARLGDSRRLRPGDWVLAVGNPFGLSSSVSLGVVSATDRRLGGPYDGFLQTDAAINPGSSGGPLFDMGGQVVGIATAYPRAAGVGFAIPASLVSELLPSLEREGGVTRGALGALFQDLTPALGRALGVGSGEGALVSGFTPDSAAEGAGLLRDDVVVALDDRPMASRNELIRAVGLHPPGSTVRVTLVRDGQTRDVQVRLGVRTDLESTGPLLPVRPTAAPAPRSTGLSLGLTVEDLSRELAFRLQLGRVRGAVVVGVTPGSSADVAGLFPGAVLTEVGGRPVHDAADAEAALRAARGGPAVLVRIVAPGGEPGLRALLVP